MAMHYCLVIELPNESIAQANVRVPSSGNPHEGVVLSRNLLDAILAGAVSGSVQVTTRDSDPSISTSGSGSQQVEYNLK